MSWTPCACPSRWNFFLTDTVGATSQKLPHSTSCSSAGNWAASLTSHLLSAPYLKTAFYFLQRPSEQGERKSGVLSPFSRCLDWSIPALWPTLPSCHFPKPLLCFSPSIQKRKKRQEVVGDASTLLGASRTSFPLCEQASSSRGSLLQERTGHQCPSDHKTRGIQNCPCCCLVFSQHQIPPRAPGAPHALLLPREGQQYGLVMTASHYQLSIIYMSLVCGSGLLWLLPPSWNSKLSWHP